MSVDSPVFRRMRSILVESIFWDDRTDELCWVDITEGTVHRGRLDGARDGSDDRVTTLPPPVSALQPAQGGGFVAALKDRIVLLDADGQLVRDLASLEHAHTHIRCNEGKVDPYGRFVIGAMDIGEAGDPDAALYVVEPDGAVELLLGGFGVANGLEWQGDEVFVTDTATKTVYRGSWGSGIHPLGALEPFLMGHASDGLTLDTDGTFWNGVYGDGCVLQWSPEGEVLCRIEIPAPNVTSVAFGGPGLDTLFVGTARENLSEADLERFPLSGSIFALDVGARGRPARTFGTATERN